MALYLNSVGVLGDPMVGPSQAERSAAASIPAWIVGAFALGTFSGLIGSLGLAMRKAWAQPFLIASLAALLVLEGWTLFFSRAPEVYDVGMPLVVSAAAILIACIATVARRRGWLM